MSVMFVVSPSANNAPAPSRFMNKPVCLYADWLIKGWRWRVILRLRWFRLRNWCENCICGSFVVVLYKLNWFFCFWLFTTCLSYKISTTYSVAYFNDRVKKGKCNPMFFLFDTWISYWAHAWLPFSFEGVSLTLLWNNNNTYFYILFCCKKYI